MFPLAVTQGGGPGCQSAWQLFEFHENIAGHFNASYYSIDFSQRGLPTLKAVPVAAEPLDIRANAPLEQGVGCSWHCRACEGGWEQKPWL